MACEINEIFKLSDLNSLKAILIPGTLLTSELGRDDDYDNRWSWDEPGSNSENDPSKDTEDLVWLDKCHICISPFADIIAIADRRSLAVFKINREDDKMKPQITCGTTFVDLPPDECITSIAIAPFISQQRSNEGSVDWNAILLGFNSGFVRAYTDNGHMLLAQRFGEGPVTRIQLQTFYSPHLSGRTTVADMGDQVDEVILVCPSFLVIIEGFAFIQCLRCARNNLAKYQSFSTSVSDLDLHLPYKKWTFAGEQDVVDGVSRGLHYSSAYDTFVSQSFQIGPGGTRKTTAPVHETLSVGESPFLAFSRLFEEKSQNILNDVTQAMVNKVKTFLPLFGGHNEEREKVEISVPITLDISFYDQHRKAKSIYLSPNKDYAAVIDDFGRVNLVDTKTSIIVRMWKGYRDAQCAFIEAQEDLKEVNSRKALFLCIYAPKRGIVEIWRCQYGPRIVAYHVGKHCKLLYCDSTLFGLNHILYPMYSKKCQASTFPRTCYLLDCTTGTVYSLQVPFVSSVTEQSDLRVRDQLLLKELKTRVSEKDTIDKCVSTLGSLRDVDLRRDALLFLIDSAELDLIVAACKSIRDDLPDNGNGSDDEVLLSQTSVRVLQLVRLYQYLKDANASISPSSNDVPDIDLPQDIWKEATKLGMDAKDFTRCISLFNFKDSLKLNEGQRRKAPAVTLSFPEFVSQFRIKAKDSEATTDVNFITLESLEDLNNELYWKLASFMFTPMFYSKKSDDILETFVQSHIKDQSLLNLLFASFLGLNSTHYSNWLVLFKTAKSVLLHRTKDAAEQQDIPSLKTVCQMVLQSKNIPAAVIAAHTLKVVAKKLTSQLSENDNESDLSDSDWETLSVPEERLNLLITQLEDAMLLMLLLEFKRKTEIPQFSLSSLMQSNPGIVSEVVARWCVELNLNAKLLMSIQLKVENDPLTMDETETGLEATELKKAYDEESINELFRHVKGRFPNSLEDDVLLSNCAWECVSLFTKEPTLNSCENLTRSLEYLNNVRSAVLRHNIACLVWRTFLVKKFEILARLIEKMSKVPKDRICKKELCMGEDLLENFVGFVYSLMSVIVETRHQAESEEKPALRVDEWWTSQMLTGNQMPLVFVAAHQKVSNMDVVLPHYHLATALEFIVSFQLKGHKPMSMISGNARQHLFKELNLNVSFDDCVDESLKTLRMKFLTAVTNAIANSLPSSERNSEYSADILQQHATLFSEANMWFSKVVVLAREWNLEPDELRQQYIVSLYENVCDTLAEEVMPSVCDANALGGKLIAVAGKRIKSYAEENDVKFPFPPNVIFWMNSLAVTPDLKSASLTSVETLVDNILGLSDEDSFHYRTARALRDAMKSTSF